MTVIMNLPVFSIEEVIPVSYEADLLNDYARRRVVAELTGYCEGIVSSGVLCEYVEQGLRERIIEAQNMFGIPTLAERGGLNE